MAKYKNLKELAEAFRVGDLEGWVLMVDSKSTHLHWHSGHPNGKELTEDEAEDFEYQKDDEGYELWDSPDVYILDQALTLAGIPNMGV